MTAALDFYHPGERNPYVTAITNRERSEGSESYDVEPLSEDAWLYFVLEDHATSSNMRAHAFADASLLTPWPIEIGFSAGGSGEDGGLHMGFHHSIESAFEAEPETTMLTLTAERLSVLSTTFERWIAYDHKILDLRKAVAQLGDLQLLRRNPSLRFLGLFAILESIVTHAPKLTDPNDSITRQVTQKMLLLGRRFEFPLQYEEFFGAGTNANTIWKKLYAVRSAFAHGGAPDFEKELKLLRNLDHCTRFVRLAISAVLRQAMVEPQLIADLRNC